jgi:hypothetical protein
VAVSGGLSRSDLLVRSRLGCAGRVVERGIVVRHFRPAIGLARPLKPVNSSLSDAGAQCWCG